MAKATTGTGKVRTTRKKPLTPAPEDHDEGRFGELLDDTASGGEVEADHDTHTGPIDAETHAKYEEIKRGDIHITQLQKMTVSELHEVAKQEGLETIRAALGQGTGCTATLRNYRKDGSMFTVPGLPEKVRGGLVLSRLLADPRAAAVVESIRASVLEISDSAPES